MSNNPYNENYYKSLNYTDYLSRETKYEKTAEELDELLGKFFSYDTRKNMGILDYGGAVGFLCQGFKRLGYIDVVNCELSDWAREESKKKNIESVAPEYCFDYPTHWDLITALDVFEHMTDRQIETLLLRCDTQFLVVRIPCAEGIGKTFHLEVSKKDPTHINIKSASEWETFIKRVGGFNAVLPLRLKTIYDSPGVFCALFIKEGED